MWDEITYPFQEFNGSVIDKTVNIIEIKLHANWRSAAILSLVLDFILLGLMLSPLDHIHCLIGLLVSYRCVHKWSHNAADMKDYG